MVDFEEIIAQANRKMYTYLPSRFRTRKFWAKLIYQKMYTYIPSRFRTRKFWAKLILGSFTVISCMQYAGLFYKYESLIDVKTSYEANPWAMTNNEYKQWLLLVKTPAMVCYYNEVQRVEELRPAFCVQETKTITENFLGVNKKEVKSPWKLWFQCIPIQKIENGSIDGILRQFKITKDGDLTAKMIKEYKLNKSLNTRRFADVIKGVENPEITIKPCKFENESWTVIEDITQDIQNTFKTVVTKPLKY